MTFTLLHGTTLQNAIGILSVGFRPSRPLNIATAIEAAFDLGCGDIYNHEGYSFARNRIDLGKVHFTTNIGTAGHFSVPEQVQDAMGVVYRILFPAREDEHGREYRQREAAWFAQNIFKVISPGVILSVEIERDIVLAQAFGRVLTEAEFETLLDGELPETLSLPLSALNNAKVSIKERV